MTEIINYSKLAITAIGGFIGTFLGGFDGFIYALLCMVVLDYILGVIIAILKKKLSSAIGFRGIAKKVFIFALVGVGALIDTYIIQNGNIIRTAIIFFYFANEGISIVENAAVLGLPIPQKLRDVLAQLKEDGNKGIANQKKQEQGGKDEDK